MGVSLIQSNGAGFGVGIAEPSTKIFLHNRGIGFNLIPDHAAEYRPRRRPPHTLSPAMVMDPNGALRLVLGTMGGDSQPQILLQLLARMLRGGERVGDAIASTRWVLRSPDFSSDGFSTWHDRGRVGVLLEPGSPRGWLDGLLHNGHRAVIAGGNFGHAHAIACFDDHLEGASDPRALGGAAAGY
jgi:gamma-glutamyltranspeptidase/glutathione hydrolase